MRPVWNLLGLACERSAEAAIAVRAYLPVADLEQESAFRKLLHARDQMSELSRKVNRFLLESSGYFQVRMRRATRHSSWK